MTMRRAAICWSWLFLLTFLGVTSAVTANNEPEPVLFIHAIPSADGHEVWVWANIGRSIDRAVSGTLCDSVCGNCQAMTCTTSECVAILTCFPSGKTVEGQMSVTITLSPTRTLESGPLPFVRAVVRASQPANLISTDHRLELTILPNSLPTDAYVFILANSALPGVLAPTHRLIGQPYSVRASGALVSSDKPMSLRLSYDALELAGATPHNLSIFAWDPLDQTWWEQGGTLFTDYNHLSTPTTRFTTYALFEGSVWRDTFADTSGLSLVNDTSPTPTDGLILRSNAISGTFMSIPIIPTTTIMGWGYIVFTSTVPAATSLTVDVLSLDGQVLRTNVTSGESLANIDPVIHPGLILRGTLFTALPGPSPMLHEWRITWHPASFPQIFLPIVIH